MIGRNPHNLFWNRKNGAKKNPGPSDGNIAPFSKIDGPAFNDVFAVLEVFPK